MRRNDELQNELNVWFELRGRTTEWSRSINPPGDKLHLCPPGLRVLVYDLTLEDNNLDSILEALIPEIERRLDENIMITLKSNLTTEVE